jgi:GrpB-like predicted nucleotidyltransferase (UPF0157 family)
MVIVEYNEEWPLHFLKIKEELEKYLSPFFKIEHVGSTSIKGMCGKPIIDIVIVVKDDENFNQIKNDLEKYFGYFHIGNWAIIDREVFKRRNSLHKMCTLEQELLDKNIFKHNGCINSKILDTIEHNLYVCKADAGVLKGYILFRDYLNNNSEEMQQYKDIKIKIIEKHGNENYDEYVQTKIDEYGWFFMEILNKAIKLENQII